MEEEKEEEEEEEDGVERRERVGKGWRGLRGEGRERIRNIVYVARGARTERRCVR